MCHCLGRQKFKGSRGNGIEVWKGPAMISPLLSQRQVFEGEGAGLVDHMTRAGNGGGTLGGSNFDLPNKEEDRGLVCSLNLK